MDLTASPFALAERMPLAPGKFVDPDRVVTGEPRAAVQFAGLDCLWVNTGTLCNLACPSCYIESSPRNDALVYPTAAEILPFFREAKVLGARTIGFTGGEPFMNPEMLDMMEAALDLGFGLLVLTNAMRPMRRHDSRLGGLARRHGDRVVMRVSLDHWRAEIHDAERGEGSWAKAVDGLAWLSAAGFGIAVAGRRGPDVEEAGQGYAALLERLGLSADHVTLFPTMDAGADVPEISEHCWSILGLSPDSLMCASSRMVVKARGAPAPHVVACTLLPHDPRFALGATLAEAQGPVPLNHPHCARFCVLGGASCSG